MCDYVSAQGSGESGHAPPVELQRWLLLQASSTAGRRPRTSGTSCYLSVSTHLWQELQASSAAGRPRTSDSHAPRGRRRDFRKVGAAAGGGRREPGAGATPRLRSNSLVTWGSGLVSALAAMVEECCSVGVEW